MFESRCGICCEQCQRRQSVSCRGCVQMDKPFWGGECMVKSCCEDRGLDHCGLCQEFPCPQLSAMGAEEGFDPAPRLESCRKWAEEWSRAGERHG